MGVSIVMTSRGKTLTVEIVGVSPLSTEAILGLDFLHAYQALIDLPNSILLTIMRYPYVCAPNALVYRKQQLCPPNQKM